jgi:hypothetical protein
VDRISIRIPVVGELLGVHNTYIKVLLEDVRGLARVVHGPYTTSYTVIARTSTFLRKTEGNSNEISILYNNTENTSGIYRYT